MIFHKKESRKPNFQMSQLEIRLFIFYFTIQIGYKVVFLVLYLYIFASFKETIMKRNVEYESGANKKCGYML